jgi:polyadenylate-binding protein 2
MKQRVEEMEREAKKLRELQAAAENSVGIEQAEGSEEVPMETEDEKAAIDSRSVFVGNVSDTYSCPIPPKTFLRA